VATHEQLQQAARLWGKYREAVGIEGEEYLENISIKNLTREQALQILFGLREVRQGLRLDFNKRSGLLGDNQEEKIEV